ncbi:uncharacterized protein METZ01_LOCUS317850, partial [marine metagenome]
MHIFPRIHTGFIILAGLLFGLTYVLAKQEEAGNRR